MAQEIAALAQRIDALESDNRTLHARFTMSGTRDLRSAVDEIETWVTAQLADPPETRRNVELKVETVLQTLTQLMNSSGGGRKESSWFKSVLESKGTQDVAMIDTAKTYRPWNKKMKNALDLIRPKSREKLEVVEQLTEEQVISAFNELKAKGEIISTKRQAIIT